VKPRLESDGPSQTDEDYLAIYPVETRKVFRTRNPVAPSDENAGE